MVTKYLPVDALTCSHKGCPQMELLGNIKYLYECNCMIINKLDSLLINWSWVRIPVLVLFHNPFIGATAALWCEFFGAMPLLF